MQEVPEYGREWNIPLDIQLDNGSAQFDCDPREDVDLSRVGLTSTRTHGAAFCNQQKMHVQNGVGVGGGSAEISNKDALSSSEFPFHSCAWTGHRATLIGKLFILS